MSGLWVIMPVYNEQACIQYVVDEWLTVLRKTVKDFKFCILNDGSKDSTLEILQAHAIKNVELKIINKENSGHGQTCILGYQLAIDQGAEWILQIDSDGQCNADYFPSFWSERSRHQLMYGYRYKRDDGYSRFLISRVVSLVTWLATGVWLKDPNVPFRLMRADTFLFVLRSVPSTFYLANIAVSVLHKNQYNIHWINIYFRNRIQGNQSVKKFDFVKKGIELYQQLKILKSNVIFAQNMPKTMKVLK